MLVGLIDTEKISRPKTQDMSPIQKQFHEAIVGGTPEFRIRYCRSAIPLLGYNQEVFAKYAEDLVNPETDPEARTEIFQLIAGGAGPEKIAYGPVDDRAKLFLEIADDALAGDKRKLKFAQNPNDKSRVWSADTLMRLSLIKIYRSAADISAETKKQFLIPQLERIVGLLSQPPIKKSRMLNRGITTSISDFEFLIEHLRGNADAEMPASSIFRKLDGGGLGSGGVF